MIKGMGKPGVCPGKKYGFHQSSFLRKGKKPYGITLLGSHKLDCDQSADKADFPGNHIGQICSFDRVDALESFPYQGHGVTGQ